MRAGLILLKSYYAERKKIPVEDRMSLDQIVETLEECAGKDDCGTCPVVSTCQWVFDTYYCGSSRCTGIEGWSKEFYEGYKS